MTRRRHDRGLGARQLRMTGGLLLAALATGCASTSGYQMDSSAPGVAAPMAAAATGQTMVPQAARAPGAAEAGEGLRGLKVAVLQLAAADGATATDAAVDSASEATGSAATEAASEAASGAADAAASAVGDALPSTDLSENLPTAGLKLEHLTTYDPKDPLQAYNRVMQNFNDQADRYALKPVAQAYDFIVPDAVQFVVRNFFSNLGDVWNSVNNLLQWKPKEALNDATRFVLNSSLGMFGIADVASAIGMEKHNEDFGQTLGYWGVPAGPYVVLPLFGPSTVRDALARPLDGYGSYYVWVDDAAVRNSLYVVEKISDRAALLEAEKAFDDAALDRYTLLRDGWLARRKNLVYDGNPPEDEEDPYGEEDPYADDPYAEDAGAEDVPASEQSK